MEQREQHQININSFCVYAGIILVFSGTVNTLVVSAFRGPGSILLGYLFFIGTLSKDYLYNLQSSKKSWHSAVWLFVFVVVYSLGMELFSEKSRRIDFLGYPVTLEAYHVLKSVPLWLLGYVVATNSNQIQLKNCFTLLCVLLVWGMLATMLALQEFPEYIRDRTAGTQMDHYSILGAMGYELTYTIPIVAFSIFETIKRWNRVAAYAFLILSMVYVTSCSLLLVIIAMILNVVLSAAMSFRSHRLRIAFGVFFISLAVWSYMNIDRFGGMLIEISEHVDDINIQMRLDQIGRLLKYGDDDGASLNRIDLYLKSLRGFAESPILGMLPVDNNYLLSGHSTILDNFSSFGLFTGVPFAAFCILMYQYFCVEIVNQRASRIAKVGVITFAFIALFNPVLANVHIMFGLICILPLCAKKCDEDEWDARSEEEKNTYCGN